MYQSPNSGNIFNLKLFPFIFVSFLMFAQSLSAQTRTFTLPPYRVDVSSAASVSRIDPGNVQYRAGNGAFDQNGNLLFYVRDLGIYRADNSLMAGMLPYVNGAATCGSGPRSYNVVQKEIAVVPKPGTCNQFYVIWIGSSCSAGNVAVRYGTVNMGTSPSSWTEAHSQSSYLDFPPATFTAGLAVSKADGSGNRTLYVVTDKGYNYYSITAGGISKVNTGSIISFPLGIPTNVQPSEVDLSPDGQKIAWGSSVSRDIILATVAGDKSLTFNPPSQILATEAVWGVEWDASSSILFANGYSFTNNSGGLYKGSYNSSNPITFNQVYNDYTKSISQLETGSNGKLYAIDINGKLVEINPSVNPATATVLNLSAPTEGPAVFMSNSSFNVNDIQYSLPDQVDGDNYAVFTGVGPLSYTTVGVKSNGFDVTPSGGSYGVNQCNAITLVPTASNYSGYNLQIFSSTSTGAQGTLLHNTGNVAGAYPTSLDIATLGTFPMRQNTGYFLVRLTLNHTCSGSSSRDVLILSKNLFTYTFLSVKNTATVTASGGNYKVYNCKPLTLVPTYSNATQYRLSLRSATSSGQVITGAGALEYTPTAFTNGAFPSTADLRNWPGTNSYIANMTTGYVLAKLELKDYCHNPISYQVLLQVNSLSLATADFLINYGDGTPIDPDNTSLTSPAATGQYAVGVNARSSTGFIDTYTMKIEKMNQSNGTVIEQVCDFPAGTQVPNNTASDLPLSIGLNGYASGKCGKPAGYFAQTANVNQVYRLSFVVTNPCGTSTAKVGYFRNSDPNARMDETAGSMAATENAISLYPNPGNGEISLEYLLPDPARVSLTITDSRGNEVLTVIKEQEQAGGRHSQKVDLTDFPDGIYYYHLTAGKPVTGKIVKITK